MFATQEIFTSMVWKDHTLVLIDGMPIVSGLSTVYGLSGIPNSLRVEIETVSPASFIWK
jgi:outer membrane receptor for ferrienterochelin and colicins